MMRPIRKTLFLIGGFFLILLGITGLILPILPGWPFIFIGLSMIAPAAAFSFKYKLQSLFLKKPVFLFSEWKKRGADAGVTTRFFPLVLHKTDELDEPANREKFRAALKEKAGISGNFVYLNQVHGANIAVFDAASGPSTDFKRIAEADGILTDRPDVTLLAMTADCLSVFLRAPGWVGVVHAGWRGTRLEILKSAIRLLHQRSGCGLGDIQLIFGPAICVNHYEVGQEFEKYFSAPQLRKKEDRFYFDLTEENRRQARAAGVPLKNMRVAGLCTISDNRIFYSFRKEKEAAGRMISFIRLRTPESAR